MRTVVLAALALAVLPGAAAAQAADNFLAGLMGAADVTGQGFAEGVASGPSVFVTASGHAPRPAEPARFALDLEASAPTATAALDALGKAEASVMAAARRRAAQVQAQDGGFDEGGDGKGAVAKAMAAVMGGAGAGAGAPAATAPPPPIRAKATVWVSAPDPAAEAAILDSVKAEAVKSTEVTFKLQGKGHALIPGLDFGKPAEPLDGAAWDGALRQALAEARREADIAAAATGASVGAPRQIVVLTRQVEPTQLTVSVAVRYALTQR